MKKTLLLLSLPIALCFGACDDDDDNTTTQNEIENVVGLIRSGDEYQLYRETDYGDDWIYVSLANVDTVAVSEDTHKESTEWDVAFNRYNIRTNSGLSGSGNGGALKTDFTSLSLCTAVPEGATFATDTVVSITASFSLSTVTATTGPATMESTANTVLAEAMAFAGPPPSYTPSKNVFIIRAADGKTFYKFMAVGFYNDEGESGYYSFKLEKL